MSNSDIADILKLYADLSELHDGNPFKIKSYAAAAFRIDKMPIKLEEKSLDELEKIEGVVKSIAQKIYEINTTESFTELNELLQKTPKGVLQIMQIKGLGPKKVAVIWNELGIETIGELIYACTENRLAQAKGFGLKTQASVIQQIEFMFASANKFHYAKVEKIAANLVDELKTILGENVSVCGALRRKLEIIDCIEIVVADDDFQSAAEEIINASILVDPIFDGTAISGKVANCKVQISLVKNEEYTYQLFIKTGSENHIAGLALTEINKQNTSEEEIYSALNLQFIEPELREGLHEIEKAKSGTLKKLIEFSDLKGILHNHSIWSDGLNSIEEMANYCIQHQYEYFGIADHSKAAFYAKGLKEEQVINQHIEIDKLNTKLFPFKIFKGTECDILNDGSLDYSDDVLKTFDYVVASIHSNLKMNEEKAMHRLLRAIENPHTTILGHPTGRLLLIREGYPIDHKKIIDACAANKVVIEINANPYRLDLDWRWIDYALNKNVRLSINPDAHECEGLHDMYYGTLVARKGGLYKEMCLNAMSRDEIAIFFNR